MDECLFVLVNELGECLVDGGLILVVLIEDDAGEVGVEVHEIFEGEDDTVFVVLDGLFDAGQVLELIVLLPLLDESGEFPLDIVVELSLGQLAPLHFHGAKILSIRAQPILCPKISH